MYNKIMKFLGAAFWGSLILLAGLFLYVLAIPPVLTYIATTLGKNSIIGVVLSLVVMFGALALIGFASIETTRRLAQQSK